MCFDFSFASRFCFYVFRLFLLQPVSLLITNYDCERWKFVIRICICLLLPGIAAWDAARARSGGHQREKRGGGGEKGKKELPRRRRKNHQGQGVGKKKKKRPTARTPKPHARRNGRKKTTPTKEKQPPIEPDQKLFSALEDN